MNEDVILNHHASHLLLALSSALLIHVNFALLCHFPQRRRLRYLYLALSGPLALVLVQRAVLAFNKALSVQIAGAYFATYLKAVEYCVVEDPCPMPRTYLGYLLVTLREVFIPFEDSGAAVRATGKENRSRAVGKPSVRNQYPHLQRTPLAAPGSSYPAAAGQLIMESLVQYLVYDILLTLCVKPLTTSAVTNAQPGFIDPLSEDDPVQPPALLSVRSLLASVAFTACLYVHFAMSFRIGVLTLSLAQPPLLYTCRHQFQQPWRGLTCVGELWQRWHQMFRVTFVRLAYRPARALATRMLRRAHAKAGSTSSGGSRHIGGDSSNCGARSAWGASAGSNGANGLQAGTGGGHESGVRDRIGGGGGGGGGDGMVAEAVAVMAVFLLSGFIHEYMCWAAFGRAQGWQLAFFTAHGAAALLENVGRASWLAGRLARGVKATATAVFCVLSSVVFMRPWLLAGYHQDFWHPVSPVRWLLDIGGGGHLV